MSAKKWERGEIFQKFFVLDHTEIFPEGSHKENTGKCNNKKKMFITKSPLNTNNNEFLKTFIIASFKKGR